MEEINVQIKELHQLLQTLLKKHNSLQKENEHLKQVNQDLIKALLEKEDSMQSAEQKIAAKTLASIYDEGEKKLLHQKIDVYLRDIEKCLSLLNA